MYFIILLLFFLDPYQLSINLTRLNKCPMRTRKLQFTKRDWLFTFLLPHGGTDLHNDSVALWIHVASLTCWWSVLCLRSVWENVCHREEVGCLGPWFTHSRIDNGTQCLLWNIQTMGLAAACSVATMFCFSFSHGGLIGMIFEMCWNSPIWRYGSHNTKGHPNASLSVGRWCAVASENCTAAQTTKPVAVDSIGRSDSSKSFLECDLIERIIQIGIFIVDTNYILSTWQS